MTTSNEYFEYFKYLKRRSRLGNIYRQNWLYPRLTRRLKGRTLDLGCGIGDMLIYRSNTVGVDINPNTVAFCKTRGVEAHLMTPDTLPFSEMEFDSVLMDNVLEHLKEPAPLLTEVRRVLSTKGRLLIGVPGLKGFNSNPDHKIQYDERNLIQLIESSGFRHLETFHTPLFKSDWLSSNIRQYCIYACFERGD